jgi:hypothetical protein
VQAQIHHGLREAGYGYWGFSPANVPEGGYDVYGVDGIGMNPDGNPSNEDKTLIDHGYLGSPTCPDRPAKRDPPQSAYTNGVVTPHASFLALRHAPREALANLGRLERNFRGLYGKWGFRDTVNVDSGRVSDFYLSLDQGMIMAALGNALGGDVLRHAYVTRATEQKLRPLLGGDDRIDGGGGDDAIFGNAGATGWRAATPCRAAEARTCSRPGRTTRGRPAVAATRRRTPRRAPRTGGRRRSAGRRGR